MHPNKRLIKIVLLYLQMATTGISSYIHNWLIHVDACTLHISMVFIYLMHVLQRNILYIRDGTIHAGYRSMPKISRYYDTLLLFKALEFLYGTNDNNVFFSYHFQQRRHFKIFMHYTQHLLVNTQRYIDISIMHIESLCIVIHRCITVLSHLYYTYVHLLQYPVLQKLIIQQKLSG